MLALVHVGGSRYGFNAGGVEDGIGPRFCRRVRPSLRGERELSVLALLNKVHLRQEGLAQAARLYRDRLAPDFNPFEFITMNEMGLSNMLGWLLNPKASHGQGIRFLQAFIQRLLAGKDEFQWPVRESEIAVRTEVRFDDGRLDIVITSTTWMIVIENKAGADEQDNQITRYDAYLDKQQQAETRLVFLTPDGALPESIDGDARTARINTGRLHCWSYTEHLHGWLSECHAICRADRVSIFIDEFMRHIRKRFAGETDMTLRSQLLQDVTASSVTIASAMELVLAANDIQKHLICMLKSQIEARIADHEGWSLPYWDVSGRASSGFSIAFAGLTSQLFSVEFCASSYNRLAFGVSPPPRDGKGRPYDVTLRTTLIEKFGSCDRGLTKTWPWIQLVSNQNNLLRVERDWGSSVEPWTNIVTGKLAETIVDTAGHFQAELSRLSRL